MAGSPFDIDPLRVQAELDGNWVGGTADYWKAFAWSAAESVPELVGRTPSEETLAWRASNPWANVGSQAAGMVVPYMGWMKAARGIKSLEGMAKAAEASRLERPFSSMAKADAIRLAPFEIGRVGISTLVGDKPITEMGMEAALNLTVGSVLSGGLGVLAASGKAAKPLKDLLPDVDPALLSAPPQLLRRHLEGALPNAAPENAPALTSIIQRLDEEARKQVSARHTTIKEVDGLFKPGVGEVLEKRLPITGEGPTSFRESTGWASLMQAAEVDPQDVGRFMQYPRLLTLGRAADDEVLRTGADVKALPSQRVAAALERKVTKGLGPTVGDNWFVKREPDDGMFVMAKKLGELGKASTDDKWLIFKTDDPGRFAKKSDLFQQVQMNMEKWRLGSSQIERNIGKPGELFSALWKLTQDDLSANRITAMVGPRNGARTLHDVLDRVTPSKLKDNMPLKHMVDLTRAVAAPAIRQFTPGTLGQVTYGHGKLIQDGVEDFWQRLLQGKQVLDPGKAAIRQVLTGNLKVEGRGVVQALDDLDRNGLIPEFWQMVRRGLTPEEGAAAGLNPMTVGLAKEIEGLTGNGMAALNTFEDAAGRSKTRLRKGHYGLSRTWDGDHLVPLRNEQGQAVGLAAGRTKVAAEKEARELAQEMSADLGRKITPDAPFMRGRPETAPPDLRAYLTTPGFMFERRNMRGFKWDRAVPTKQELIEEYQRNFSSRGRAMGALGREAILSQQVARLAVEDPQAYQNVVKRFNMMTGLEGEFSAAQNKAVDKALAPFLGSGSATKIVRATNEGMMHLQLGAANIAHPITNVVGTLQTVAPELAFVLNADPNTLRSVYHTLVPAMGTQGPVGWMGVLSPLKIMGQAVKEMAKPDKATMRMIERGVNERVLIPRVIEDLIGQNRRKLTDWKQGMKSPSDFVGYLGALSEFLPSTSETFARQIAFHSGIIAARDILKVADEDLIYRFARQMTERTQYLYASSDRPLMFTSPLGSSMGLFKNWMMNYVATMAEYANLGVQRNIWSPLLWQTLGTFAVGGAAATPAYWAAQAASEFFANKSLMQWSYDEFEQKEADGLMYGLPAWLTGVSLSSQMSSPGSNPVRDASQMFSFAAYDRAKALAGSVGSAFDNFRATGTHPANDPDVRNQLIKAFAPVTLYRTMATQEEGVVKNLGTDLPQITGMNPWDISLYRTGLRPVMLERHMRAVEEVWKDRESNKRSVQALGDAYLEAMKIGDQSGMNMILLRAQTLGVDISSVLGSAVTRFRNEQTPVIERLAGRRGLADYESILARE